MTCPRCADCPDSAHHWLPNDDFGADDEDAESSPDHEFACKHCPAVGDECDLCEGSGEAIDDESGNGHPCPRCDEEGVVEAGTGRDSAPAEDRDITRPVDAAIGLRRVVDPSGFEWLDPADPTVPVTDEQIREMMASRHLAIVRETLGASDKPYQSTMAAASSAMFRIGKLEAEIARLRLACEDKERHLDGYRKAADEDRAVIEKLKTLLRQSDRYGLAMTWGWADRNAGIAADACPHAMNDAEKQHWDKGWQWRDDQLALKAAQEENAQLRADFDEAAGIPCRVEGSAVVVGGEGDKGT